MGNWIPNDPTLVEQILRISSAYSPPPPEGFISPMTWGSQEQATQRFGQAGVPADRILRTGHLHVQLPAPASELLAAFRTYYGPTMNAYEAASASGREEDLHGELEALFNEQNASPSENATSIPATFLRVSVVV